MFVELFIYIIYTKIFTLGSVYIIYFTKIFTLGSVLNESIGLRHRCNSGPHALEWNVDCSKMPCENN